MSELTHFDSEGKAIMVDVGEKENTRRVAVARGEVRMQPEVSLFPPLKGQGRSWWSCRRWSLVPPRVIHGVRRWG